MEATVIKIWIAIILVGVCIFLRLVRKLIGAAYNICYKSKFRETTDEQQTQINDLTREVEEMKRKTEEK